MPEQRNIRVGVTGHRFLHDLPVLNNAILAAFEKISGRHPNQTLLLYNPLAPGADQLAGFAALESDIPIVVVLPFEQGEYLADFSEEDRRTFIQLSSQAQQIIQLPAQDTGASAYQALGEYLVEHIDYLIAIWNGQPARGPGGTGEVVENFRKTGKPLVWIRADNMLPENPVRLPLSLKQGSITSECQSV